MRRIYPYSARKRAWWDAGVLVVLYFLLAAAFMKSDTYERVTGVFQKYEVYELDDLVFSAGMAFCIVLLIFSVRRLRDARRFETKADLDPLTGLVNKRSFNDMLDAYIRVAGRSRQPLSVIVFDVDDFKRFNDLCGHVAGDMILVSLSKRIQAMLRKQDLLARWGGEEFTILLPDTTLAEAAAAAERIRESVCGQHEGAAMPVTASFGVAELQEGETPAELAARADVRMYEAKAAGKNAVRF